MMKNIMSPGVLELAKVSTTKIPARYERHDQEPLSSSTDASLLRVPVIDLERLDVGEEQYPSSELERLHAACKDWGFFQVVNHGVRITLLEEFKLEVENLFRLPYAEKQKLWLLPDNQQGFGQLFVVSEEQKLDWSDMFYLKTFPLHLRRNDLFGNLPPKLREILELYCKEMKKLAMTILCHMAQALKIDSQEMKELFSDESQAIRMNYYPPCPEPDKAMGLTPHSDAGALTIVFQLNETEGLQIRNQGTWIPVKPLPNAFVVNVGNIMEIISNGAYKSIEHRVTVNSSKERLSVAAFHSSNLQSMLGPSASIIGPDNPPIFRQIQMEEYVKGFFARKLSGKSYLDSMRI